MISKPIFLYSEIILLSLLVSCNKTNTLFTSLPASKTNISFTNKLENNDALGILNYIYYYNGGGVAAGDINNDGLTDIYFTANSHGNNKLYLNKGDFEFEDITEKAGTQGTADWCSGVTMADVNGDGLLDIYVCAVANMHGLTGKNQLFINNGNATFTDRASEYGLDFSGFSTQAAFFDFDRDGDLDCYLLNQSEHPNQNLTDTSFRRIPDAYAGDRLYRNDTVNGHSKFTDVSAKSGIYQSKLGYGLGIAVADFNNDGWDDIYVGNDFHENDYYYLNNGDGTFSESGAKHFRHYSRYSMGNDAADYNNDGQMDIITADMLPADEKILKTYGNGEHLDVYNQKIKNKGYQDQYSKNCLQMNNGDGVSYSDLSFISGVSATDWSWSPLFADFDNDGNKDLFISSGIVKRPLDLDFIMFFSNASNRKAINNAKSYKALLDKMPDGYSHPYLYSGDGRMTFKDVSNDWGTGNMKGYFTGAAWADLNNDGNLDIVINCIDAPAVILKNNAPPKNSLSISFRGDGMNKTGIGAKAYVYSGGNIQYQQLMLTRGFISSSEPRMHFGLDSTATIDSVLVIWPNQQCQLLTNVPTNKPLIVKQADAANQFSKEQYFQSTKKILQDVTNEIKLDWSHKENDFNEFNNEYLIPHLESTRGPKMAVGDVNKDRLDDIFVCGGKGQAGCLMLQNGKGQFVKSDTDIFEKNKMSEGVAALFFDANNDGYPDLYTVSGGNEYEDGNPNLADHLYLNDGKGHFKEPGNLLPSILKNKSCVAAADVNKDGFIDLFVGGLTQARKYAYTAQPSYLMLNDGKANFKLAGETVFSLKENGLVTSAAFADVNGDGWMDLIIAGEWMGVKIFFNEKGTFKPSEINNSSGLWQCVYATDINGDGFTDLFAGNWGKNSKLYSGKDGAVRLHVKDFDGNGSIEQVMTYSINGNEYTFLGKDNLEQALPILKKTHLTYDEVAGKNVEFMFGDRLSNAATLKAEILSSSYFLNDGKGNFTRMDLPNELQLAPIFTFNAVEINNTKTYLAAGNFYGVQPYENRYDALAPTLFSFDGKVKVLQTIPDINTEARDSKQVNTVNNKKLLVISNNNSELLFFK